MSAEMKIKALLPYYGSDRMMVGNAADMLDDVRWLGIPFAASLGMVARCKVQTILCNDLHRHSINLGRVVADKKLKDKLVKRLTDKLYHPDEVKVAQAYAKKWVPTDEPDLVAAEYYFVSQWMGRSGMAGTKHEFSGSTSPRWCDGGGDSNTRYRSAVASLDAWHEALQRCTFTTLDYKDFLKRCPDRPRHAIYCDPPFPGGAGDKYLHAFEPKDHKRLYKRVARFEHTKVIMRYYVHPLVEELYADKKRWKWNYVGGRKTTNEKVQEVLIVNRLAASE